MPDRCGPAWSAPFHSLQRLKRKQPGRGQIVHAMLVMDGERLGRFADDSRRTAADFEQRPPARCRLVMSAGPPPGDREQPERIDAQRVEGAARRAAAVQRVAEGVARAIVVAGARVDAAERDRFARIARGFRPGARQVEQPRRQRRQRQEIAAIVLENGGQRVGVARPHEMEIAAGHLEARDVACAADTQDLALQRDERTGVLA